MTKYAWVQSKTDKESTDGFQRIMITDESTDYFGIVFHFGKIRLHPDEEPPRVQFTYYIEHVPPTTHKHDRQTLHDDENFKELLANILSDILKEKYEGPGVHDSESTHNQ